jgi:hypothetical protein
MKHISIVLLALSLCLIVACGLGDQTEEANKLVDEANVLISKSNELSPKSNKLFTELLGDNLTKVEDLVEYKEENKAKFAELTTLSDQIDKLGSETIEKFEQASKLKLDEKYKDYLIIKIQELRKRSEGDKLTTPFVKTFLDTKEVGKINKQIEDYNKKTSDIGNEADELMKKADQIVKDNPNTIKT